MKKEEGRAIEASLIAVGVGCVDSSGGKEKCPGVICGGLEGHTNVQ